jgi:FKBP-type peptidyl-prolyl cis-trans isomerase 2
MAAAKDGDKVKVHYKGTLDDGSVFDSSAGKEPLEFTLGAGGIIPGFENGVKGMEKGEKKTIKIPCAQAYGPIQPDGITEVPKTEFPKDLDLQLGRQFQMSDGEGSVFVVTVINVTDDKVTIDGNHPLAGKDLTFELELVSIDGI